MSAVCPCADSVVLTSAPASISRFVAGALPDAAANPDGFGAPHSVLTTHLVDREGEPTREALDEVLDLFRERLLVGA